MAYERLQFDDAQQLTHALEGADLLFNTYWIRFPRHGITFGQAVANSRVLFQAASRAGVGRIVHLSVTNASAESPYAYFRGKAEVERVLAETSGEYAVIRPSLVFGGREEILINNMAWLLRHLPLYAVPGDGRYRVQPVFVGDVAELAVAAGDPPALRPRTPSARRCTRSTSSWTCSAALKTRTRLVHLPPRGRGRAGKRARPTAPRCPDHDRRTRRAHVGAARLRPAGNRAYQLRRMASRCVKLAGAAIRQRASTKLGGMTMHTLHLLRHAKSSWDDDSLADHERPLSPRGVRDAKRIGKHLGTVPAPPDVVLCSSAVRTRQTLDLVRSSLGDATVHIEEGLYGASAGELLERLRGIPDTAGSALVVGHNPGIQDLTLDLAAPGPLFATVSVKFPTCALATLALAALTWSGVSQGEAELIGFTTPRDLS